MTPHRILIAGVGNIFLGDDAFGVEVLQKLLQRPLPAGIEAIDFGIRGFDLICAMMDSYEAVILVDAVGRGRAPGTLYVIEPAVGEPVTTGSLAAIGGHSLTPDHVLQCVQALDGRLPPVYIVGCEPVSFGSEDDPQMGLTPVVTEAVERAIALIDSLIDEITAGRCR
jgi:hydrogenase maturation protease